MILPFCIIERKKSVSGSLVGTKNVFVKVHPEKKTAIKKNSTVVDMKSNKQ